MHDPGHLSFMNMTVICLAGELLQSCYKATNLFEICGPSGIKIAIEAWPSTFSYFAMVFTTM